MVLLCLVEVAACPLDQPEVAEGGGLPHVAVCLFEHKGVQPPRLGQFAAQRMEVPETAERIEVARRELEDAPQRLPGLVDLPERKGDGRTLAVAGDELQPFGLEAGVVFLDLIVEEREQVAGVARPQLGEHLVHALASVEPGPRLFEQGRFELVSQVVPLALGRPELLREGRVLGFFRPQPGDVIVHDRLDLRVQPCLPLNDRLGPCLQPDQPEVAVVGEFFEDLVLPEFGEHHADIVAHRVCNEAGEVGLIGPAEPRPDEPAVFGDLGELPAGGVRVIGREVEGCPDLGQDREELLLALPALVVLPQDRPDEHRGRAEDGHRGGKRARRKERCHRWPDALLRALAQKGVDVGGPLALEEFADECSGEGSRLHA